MGEPLTDGGRAIDSTLLKTHQREQFLGTTVAPARGKPEHITPRPLRIARVSSKVWASQSAFKKRQPPGTFTTHAEISSEDWNGRGHGFDSRGGAPRCGSQRWWE
jgi:hypothetical protein